MPTTREQLQQWLEEPEGTHLDAEIGASGVYTRKRGLDHETNKALIERHLRSRGVRRWARWYIASGNG